MHGFLTSSGSLLVNPNNNESGSALRPETLLELDSRAVDDFVSESRLVGIGLVPLQLFAACWEIAEVHITLEPYVKSCPGMLGPLSVSARGRTHIDEASRSKPIPTLVWLHLRLTGYTTTGAPRTKTTKAL
jgi:hypothetical protein